MKKALVVIPPDTGDPLCGQTCQAALESAGYEVSVAGDCFGHGSDASVALADVQAADLVVCETSERHGRVLYYLGLAHALGKCVFTISATPADIPFHSALGPSFVYDPLQRNRNDRLSSDLANAVLQLQAVPWNCRGESASQAKTRSFIRWALSNEIKFNLSEIERIRAKDLVFLGVWHPVERGSFPIITCETAAFESEDVQQALEARDPKSRDSLEVLYRSFYAMNEKAGILDAQVTLKNAQEYLKAVREFENYLMEEARALVERLAAKGL